MALSHTAVARVMVVGKDPIVTRALTKLLELDPEVHVLGEATSIGSAAIDKMRPDAVVLDETGQATETLLAQHYLGSIAPETKLFVLDAIAHMTVRDVLQTVKRITPEGSRDAQGRHLQAVATSTERDALASLSDRELEVVRLVAEGLSNKEISSRLTLSDKTVKNHISHILAKMNLTARTQVAVYAIRAGLV